MRVMEVSGIPEEKTALVTVSEAADAFVAECKEGNFATITVHQHKLWLARFVKWCAASNYKTMGEVDTQCLRDWFAEHDHASITRYNQRARFSAWFNFCKSRKWITDDPVKGLGKLIVKQRQTEPLTQGEFDALIAHIDRDDLLAFVLLLRWSGLRITDAVTLERSRIDADGVLTIYTHKTGAPVRMPLPPVCIEALKALPTVGKRFFARDGQNPFHAGTQFRRLLGKAWKRTAISKRCHPHCLRDTFACEMLLKGVPLDQVSMLLGHANIQTTQKHYNPWVQARQDQLSASVRAVWG